MTVKRPYSPAASGRLFGLLTSLVIIVPVVVAGVVLLRLDVFSDDGDASGATEPLAFDFDSPAEPIAFPSDEGEVALPELEPEPEFELRATVHVVQPGDTLGNLAQRYGTTVAAIVFLNDLLDPNALRVGQELQVPPADFVLPEPAAPEAEAPAEGEAPAEAESPTEGELQPEPTEGQLEVVE